MQTSLRLLSQRRFLPIFATQFLGAFNDNLFKNAMVLFAVYNVLNDPAQETWFSALATALFIIPFFLLSATSGQLADFTDKARIVRVVKVAEIVIMGVGAAGLLLPSIPLMLVALLAMGVHSTFFGPIKYAILPQHLEPDEVLGGTGLVEAGTYVAILAGTILAGVISVQAAAATVLAVALVGWWTGRQVPPAPPVAALDRIDHNPVRASFRLVNATMHVPRLFLAIVAISFFWTIGAVLFIQFPPLVKNVLGADKPVASLFLAVFSVGVAIGSMLINRLLRGEVSARFSPPAVIVMGAFVLGFYAVARSWVPNADGRLDDIWAFLGHGGAPAMLGTLLGVAIAGGVFVVPLYAFLTTTVSKGETARTVAANNIVNAGAMTIGSLSAVGVSAVDQVLMSAAMCLVSAWLAHKLHRACDGPSGQPNTP